MTFPTDYSFEELERAMEELERHFEGVARDPSRRRYGVIVDLSQVESSNARNRKRVAESLGRTEEMLRGRAVGQAFVIPSAVSRGALTAVFWIRRPGWPIKLFKTFEEADDWLVGIFAEEGITIRPRQRRASGMG